jgi:hypothetical protein
VNHLLLIAAMAFATAVTLWKSNVRGLRVCVVFGQLIVLAQFGIYLANVGRNTFEQVRERTNQEESFAEGVFAEAKAADAYAREQLLVVYVVGICLGVLALWSRPDIRRN